MYKKLLVPLDGSELSESALEHARAIASGCNVPEVVLLRVIEPIPPEAYVETREDVIRNAQKRARASVENYLSTLADDLKKEGIAAHAVVLSGKPADEILDYAKKNRADLVIMTTHGRSGPSRWVFGSVAQKIVRHCAIAVLIVPPGGCRTGESRG